MFKTIFYVFFVFSNVVMAKSTVDTDRYTQLVLKPTEEQLTPLQVVVDVKFPPQIITISESLHYLLDGSGYALIDEKYQSKALVLMLKNRVPSVHRDLSAMTLSDALSVVVGEHFRLIQDPLRRKISFILKDEYKGLIGE